MKLLGFMICLCLGFFASGRDERCSLLPDGGECRGYFKRHSFDMTSQTCAEFLYGGCGGNGNNFGTLTECQNVCDAVPDVSQTVDAGSNAVLPLHGASDPPSKPADDVSIVKIPVVPNSNPSQSKPSKSDGDSPTDSSLKSPPVHSPEGNSVFSIKPLGDKGPGKEFNSAVGEITDEQTQGEQSQSAHIDAAAGKAPTGEVSVDGRGPVAPPDSALTEATLPEEDSLPDCSSLPAIGQCRSLFRRFNYNRDRGVCGAFIFGGCGGNMNRYDTMEECEQKCLPATKKSDVLAKGTSDLQAEDGHGQ